MKNLVLFFLLTTQCFALPDAVKNFSRRLVPVVGADSEYKYFGTGWWLDRNTVCTARHVIEDSDPNSIKIFDHEYVPAKIIAEDKTYDIALLRPARSSSWDEIDYDTSPDYLDPVIICGYAAAIRNSANRPTVVLAESKIAAFDVKSMLCPSGIALATTVFSGTSGSPVITPDGEVVGLILGTQEDDGAEWFATITPAQRIQSLVK